MHLQNLHRVVVPSFLLFLISCSSPATQDDSTIGLQGIIPFSQISATDGSNSAFASRLVNGLTGADDASSWVNSGNAWVDTSYPMVAVLNLGSVRNISKLEYFVGNIPFAGNASLRLRYGNTTSTYGAALTDAPGSTYNNYKTFAALPASFSAQFIELSFAAPYQTRFNISEIQITDATTTLDAPSNLQIINKSTSSLTIGWGVVVGATSYEVERNGVLTVAQPSGATTNISHTGLTANTTYAYRVRAKNATTTGPWSVSFAATTDTPITGDEDATTMTLAQYKTANDGLALPLVKQAKLPETAIQSTAYTWQQSTFIAARNSGDCGPNTHGRYWTLGPDNKAYPTWHPPTDVTGCSFGHEHGDDPYSNEIYAQSNSTAAQYATYKAARTNRLIPIPFGYAGQVLVNNGGRRVYIANATDFQEDNVGYKIFSEKFFIANGNTANFDLKTSTGQNIVSTNITCSALVAVHQGTHSSDALTNHLHEASLHISCDNGVRVHASMMSPIGKPGYFSNECSYTNTNTAAATVPTPSNYPPLVFNGTGQANNTVNNTFVAAPGFVYPFSAGEVMPFTQNPPSVRNNVVLNSNQVPAGVTQFQPDGERVIPSQYCLGQESWATTNRIKYGWNTVENWTFPINLTNAINQAPLFTFRPYAVVLNPIRVFDDSNGATPTAKYAYDVCKLATLPKGKASDGFPNPAQKTAGCVAAQNSWKDISSPYKGNARWMNFKGIVLNNLGGSNNWLATDALGRNMGVQTNFASNIPQYVAAINFNQDAQFAGSLPIAGVSKKVCDAAASNSVTDGCYHQLDTKFRKEWWREYNGNNYNQNYSGVHAPN